MSLKSVKYPELDEISNLTGVNIWQQSQEVLEQQALHEIETFSDKKTFINNTEEGEIIDTKIKNTKGDIDLDIQAFIKKQEELQKIQQHKKIFGVSERSRSIANQISLNKENHKLRKRKLLVNNSTKSKKIKLHKTDKNQETECSSTNEELTISVTSNKNKYSRKCQYVGHQEKEHTYSDDEGIGDSLSNYPPSDDEYIPSEGPSDDSDYERKKSDTKKESKDKTVNVKKIKDDGCLKAYKTRLNLYYENLEKEKLILLHNDYEGLEDVILKGGLKITAKTWANLYSYQQEGIEWLWKLHQNEVGGLLGDEMGLGKTVQVIVFLMSLQYSTIVGRYRGLGPTLIVCPATILYQWVQHFWEWAPEIRVAVLHHTGSFIGNKSKLIKEINKDKGVIVTSYSGVLKYKGNLLEHNWHYLILDEGHKIRNPASKITVALKQIRTPHRLLLTGSPMQNNLQELWSLFDFIIPGILGTLQTFMQHFANPIVQGGYYNASQMQEATAQSVATTLKEIISPYFLRRLKSEVQRCIQLPCKTEQVLFCSLTDEQYDLYKGYIMSEHVNQILGRGKKKWYSENFMRANVLVAITTLRKICNHPDLYLEDADDEARISDDNLPVEERLGFYKRSGKMVVVSALLKMWKKQKHRVLLFTQTRGMIEIFEMFLLQQGYNYLKMDGSTSVTSRQSLIENFNKNESIDVFLLTTRVGGLGINLTGANRVIIYDPDWNPATDTQARERAWRIGQERQVTIYRLVSAGTIEEKMYQRQIWKQLLSNKVLLDPKTQKFFKTSDLHDLFSLQDQNKYSKPETTNIFRDSVINMQERLEQKKLKKTESKKKRSETSVAFSEEKIVQMKQLAKKISQNIKMNESNEKTPNTLSQLEIEQEKEQKLREKEKLKELTPSELLTYNRKKLRPKEVVNNTVDDEKLANFTFEKALQYSEKTAKLYNNLKIGKIKEKALCNEILKKKSDQQTSAENKNERYSKKNKNKSIKIDTTGTIEGEKIEGLVKLEVKKIKTMKTANECQDMFILEKLFAKKGVHSALKHDEIVTTSSSSESDRLRINSEAKRKADLALDALRKSRLNKWRW